MPDPKMFSEPRNGEENAFGLLGGSGGMLSRKIFKIKGARLAKNAFSRDFSFEKPDKNMSTRSLARKFGRFKIVCWPWGGGIPLAPLLATALIV